MSASRNPRISSRKQPRQARSSELVASILEAAVQVLASEGAQRFTTARVAERAGVSIGSLYQYFPNKAAILFRLQSDEWRRTTRLLADILEDATRPPLERLRRLVRAFVVSECEEAAIRVALNDAAPLYRDADEARAVKAEGARVIQAFLREALPALAEERRHLAGELITTTLSAVGKQFSEQPRDAVEIDRYSQALADMLCAYLEGLAKA
ncbi:MULTISPECIES: TetR family transcriptional regulator [Pseudomonas aeruginosa group]|uniref:TetR/AcrR family transcriptional regulator n=2 Tax=Pseudomonas aeruginosa group TaxID=136841 RepID=A0ABD7K7M7_PSEAI|nr:MULTISPECIES: TetR family transcriptional regulator [Pseudomonas aeruginosa group]AVK06742.1 putative transcriptional regulator [Pseudomonas paraeruginosa]AVR68726.1 TetR/AcrR family transcriptional regulator [Pseudomonas paraeruginosa]AWE92001.1 putative transcriptional regulator [Pseudomonas paraeruginosa]KAB0748239.1 TetR/AcrR family transcriptional regulator [Pseudomonas aeruginosa]KSD80368.1 TetR family transcriptional regulator [Pseudomonas aeruginosa]